MKQYSFLIENLQFKIKKEKTDFGYVLYYNCKEGRFALYYYNDDKNNIFLSNVDIWEQYQGKGFGNELLQYALNEVKKINKNHNFKILFLYCKKDSFVHNWYRKFGFKDYKDYEKDSRYIWMKKKL